LLGNIYSRRGDVVKAIDNYEFAIFLDFDIYTAHIDFARKYEHMGRHKRALEEYRAAYDIDSRDDALLDKMEYLEKKAECKNTGKCKCE
jgi:Tfp pilus assembly protein PilF